MNTSFTRNFRSRSSGRNWRKLMLAAALPTWLALGAGSALAQVGGQDSNVNIVIPAGGCVTLNQQIIPAATFPRHCAVTGSADVLHPVAANAFYTFNLTLNNVACAPLDGGMERTVQFSDVLVGGVTVPDSRIKEVTTTGVFTLPAGNVAHVIRWTGRATGAPATTVIDRSMSLTCLNSRFPLSPIP